MKISKNKIQLLMARKRLTQSALAELSDVSRQSLSYITHGKECNPATAAKIAAGLNVDVAELLEQED